MLRQIIRDEVEGAGLGDLLLCAAGAAGADGLSTSSVAFIIFFCSFFAMIGYGCQCSRPVDFQPCRRIIPQKCMRPPFACGIARLSFGSTFLLIVVDNKAGFLSDLTIFLPNWAFGISYRDFLYGWTSLIACYSSIDRAAYTLIQRS